MAKGKYKLQYQNQHDEMDRPFGNKQWLPVYDDNMCRGYTMTRRAAEAYQQEMRRRHTDVTYRIKECR